MQDRIRGDACRSFLICVDSYHEEVFAGRFYQIGQENTGTSFQSLTQLLIGIEHELNTANHPQSFTSMRTFAPIAEPRSENAAEPIYQKGFLGTFLIKVLFRQHTSWQGSVTWLEQHGEQPFRSVLELILLMDSALGQRQDKQVS